MRSFITFWKKDIINKLIVIVLMGLVGAMGAFGWLIFTMPQGKSLAEAFAVFLPVKASPTFDINSYLTPGTNVPAEATSTDVAVLLPTFTVLPPTPTVELPAPTLELLSTPTIELPTQPIQPPTQVITNGLDCIPINTLQSGKVVEVLDGSTIRVLIEKLVYVIRYIGISAPTDKLYGALAKQKNSELVYGREVTLMQDTSDKDDRGRLLRYVKINNTFVNLEMIRQGLGSAVDVPPDSSCTQVFANAEQTARTSSLGLWKLTPTPQQLPTP